MSFQMACRHLSVCLRARMSRAPMVRVAHIENEARAAGASNRANRSAIASRRGSRSKIKVPRQGFGKDGRWVWAMKAKKPVEPKTPVEANK